MPTRNMTSIFIALIIAMLCYGEAHRNRYALTLSECISQINDLYYEPVDPQMLFDDAMAGMFKHLDSYSSYISPSDIQAFRDDIQQEFGGIGIEVSSQKNQIIVRYVVFGKPAFAAGMKADDEIIAIDGQSMEDAEIDDAVKLMRGAVGTKVTVEVRRAGVAETLSFTLERATIDIESVLGDRRDMKGNWSYVLQAHPQIGYARVTTFGDHTASELATAIGQMPANMRGMIIDLRSNPGGLLDCAVQICDMFLPPNQTIVTARSRDSEIVSEFRSEQPPLVPPSVPVVILVDQYSASASEIVSACLQDYHRATIVGARTWGKGTVQNVIELDRGRSAMRLTTQTYWRPSEVNIHRHSNDTEDDPWGVIPKPENRIDYDVDTYQQVWQQRYAHDLPGATGDNAAVNADADSDAAETSNDAAVDEVDAADEQKPKQPVIDRQLERAIEVIEAAQPKITRAA
ncbi:MAG: S41 family peptidase [Planctomycetales bacterium]|nr:S41 family peptidase [Planctomycetales bacterium]